MASANKLTGISPLRVREILSFILVPSCAFSSIIQTEGVFVAVGFYRFFTKFTSSHFFIRFVMFI